MTAEPVLITLSDVSDDDSVNPTEGNNPALCLEKVSSEQSVSVSPPKGSETTVAPISEPPKINLAEKEHPTERRDYSKSYHKNNLKKKTVKGNTIFCISL